MNRSQISRRHVLYSTLAFAGASILRSRDGRAVEFRQANDRPRIAAVGTGSRWCQKATGIDGPWGSAPDVRQFGDYVAVCDADSSRRQRAAELVKEWTNADPAVYADYKAILDDPKIDIVHISTPDHWHARIAIESMLAGKDVYCEKPMTLTIPEGREICQVCEKTGRVVQIGTQQRSEVQFITAVALIQNGRLGKIRKATCSIGGAPTSPEIPVAAPPQELDWNLWQGPVAETEFRYLAGNNGETQSWSRCHYEFRWWYEYSGGKLTDWGAHHVDIACWALGASETGPSKVTPVKYNLPVEYKDGHPLVNDRYNAATDFEIHCAMPNDVQLVITSEGDNGILFEGTEGRFFVNRGKITGKPVEDLKERPLPENAIEEIYGGKVSSNHTENFTDAMKSRKQPISDVWTHNRMLEICHLSNIAMRLGRELRWDPAQREIVGDSQANEFLSRENRKGYEIKIS